MWNNKVEQLYNEWQSLQPLKPEDRKRLDDKFMLEFNYNSNHLEGNTLTYGQTKLLLFFGETSGSANFKDYEEMKAHNVGLKMMKEEAMDKERSLSEAFIRQLNKTILVQHYWKDATTQSGDKTRIEIKVGEYKSRPNSVLTATGEVFDYASPEETPAFMTSLVSWYNEEERKGELSPVELAALLHYRYIRIHPFEDGNGRIARLLVNYVLHKNGYPMLVVRSEDKENYLRILHQCDVEVGLTPSDGANAPLEKIQPFVDYLYEQLGSALTLCIKAAKGESIEEDGDFSKQLKLLAREAKQKAEKAEKERTKSPQYIDQFIRVFIQPDNGIRRRLIDPLLPAFGHFFTSVKYENKISTTQDISEGEGLDNLRDIPKERLDDLLNNAKILFFAYIFEEPLKEYNIDLSVTLTLNVEFENSYYTIDCLNDKKFNYGTYPSEEEINQIISSFRTGILAGIENAINKD